MSGPSLPDFAYVDAEIRLRLGGFSLAAALRAREAWTVLFGPSGSGKSSLLRALAGLLKPDSGHIALRGETVFDSAQRLHIPAERRRVRWAGQRTALFPDRTVRSNLAYGLAGLPDAPELLDAALDHFGLRALAGRLPAELSGGQAQRVAVVRAAAGARGGLLLLDEPFAGLDAEVRDGLAAALRSWLADTPVLLVTHDVAETLLLAEEVVRMDSGEVTAQGTPAEVLALEIARLRDVLRRSESAAPRGKADSSLRSE